MAGIATGLVIITGDKTIEQDTFTCVHCNCIVIINPKETKDFGFCTLCFAPICPGCDSIGSCTPFEKKIDELEKREYHARNRGY